MSSLAVVSILAAGCSDSPPLQDPPIAHGLPTVAPPPEAQVPAILDATPPDARQAVGPTIDRVRVSRRGRRVQVRMKWHQVEHAAKYEIQISRLVTFQRSIKQRVTSRTSFKVSGLKPGVYFWRVRALDREGDADGAWSQIQILDATKTGENGRRRRRRPAARNQASSGGAAHLAAEDALQNMRLSCSEPKNLTVTTVSPIKVAGVVSSGAVLVVNGMPVAPENSRFSVNVELKHGLNRITLEATLGDDQRRLTRSVYYANPQKLAPVKRRFEALRAQLDEVGALRGELAATVRSLKARINKTKDEGLLAEIHSEMNAISQMRQEIDTEIQRALQALGVLLGT